ncbi:ABC-type transport system substrate-binding protein [Bradyrhizobium sp. GM24.11]
MCSSGRLLHTLLTEGAAIELSFLGALPFEANGALSQSSPEYISGLGRSYSYDVGKANQLLDQAGWTEHNNAGIRLKNGKPLVVRISYSSAFLKPDGEQALQVIQQQAKAAGFDVRLQPTNQADFFAGKNLGPNDYEVVLLYWVAPGAEIFRISWKPDQNGERNRFNPSRYQDGVLWDVIQKSGTGIQRWRADFSLSAGGTRNSRESRRSWLHSAGCHFGDQPKVKRCVAGPWVRR